MGNKQSSQQIYIYIYIYVCVCVCVCVYYSTPKIILFFGIEKSLIDREKMFGWNQNGRKIEKCEKY